MKAFLQLRKKFLYNIVGAAALLLAACANLSHETDDSTGGGYKNLGELAVSVCISDGSASRYAVPSSDQIKYAALLYPDGAPSASDDFASGEFDEGGNSITFHFKRPSETEGLTIEVFAFAKDVAEADFARGSALFSGSKSGLEVVGDSITVGEPITLTQTASAPNGTVNLKIKVNDLENCTLEIDDTTNFIVEPAAGSSAGYFTVRQSGDEIPAGTYKLSFTVKNNGETVFVFSDSITVLQGMESDSWRGLPASAVDENGARVVSVDKIFYVRGEGEGWYSTNGYSSVTTSDDNSGGFMSPFATIQKAIDTVIAANDGASGYTIYVDGTLDGMTAPLLGANGMADFSALDKSLMLTIKSLSETQEATLDGGARFDESGAITEEGIGMRVVNAAHSANKTLDLTLENLAIIGGNASDYGGGVYVAQNVSLTLKSGRISGNRATIGGGGMYNSGMLIMNGGEISDNEVSGATEDDYNYGGGVYNSGTFTMTDGKISRNTIIPNAEYKNIGGGVYNSDAFEMSGGEISENTAYSPGIVSLIGTTAALTLKGNAKVINHIGTAVYFNNRGTFVMDGNAEISGNKDGLNGGGVYLTSGGEFIMNGSAKISNNTAKRNGGGIHVGSSECKITMNDSATISGNTTDFSGGGFYGMGTLTMNGDAKITGNNALRTTSGGNGGGAYISTPGWLIMNDNAAISGNIGNAETGMGGGVYINSGPLKGTLTMNDNARISGNSAYYGGGVYLKGEKVKFTMNGGIIGGATDDAKNEAVSNGGGVYITGSDNTTESDEEIFLMNGGEIIGNQAKNNYGGGLYISGKGKRFKMTGGSINNNKTGLYGGGIYISRSYIAIAGGDISGNSANRGGGIYTYESTIDFTGGSIGGEARNTADWGSGIFVLRTAVNLSGAAYMADEDSVYLVGDNTLTVAGALEKAKVARIYPSEWVSGKSVLGAGDSVTLTQAICDQFSVHLYNGAEWQVIFDDTTGTGVLQEKP